MKNLFLAALIGLLYIIPLSEIKGQTESGKPFLIKTNAQQARSLSLSELIKSSLGTGTHDSFTLINSSKATDAASKNDDAFALEKYQQHYKGIKVEHGKININYKSGAPGSISGEYYEIGDISVKPSLSEADAVSKALQHVKAKTYKWQIPGEEKMLKATTSDPNATYYPKGELVICNDYLGKNRHKPVLAYKVDVYATVPLSRDYIYVNAHTGEIVLIDPILKKENAPSVGSANTRYSGLKNISSTKADNKYYLKDYTRGLGIETFNLKHSTDASAAIDFTDADNLWSTSEFHNSEKDDAALDAFYGALKTYDYFLEKHNRSSIDGAGLKLRTYVHYGQEVFNAYWDGSVVYFGDGYGQAEPLTTLDIAGHEIGHGLCQYTAGLVYSYESGALNEALSDIWGACVEYYSDPTKATWTVGEDMKQPIRSMNDPKLYENPDTYKGTYWYTEDGDYGGVHYNSGVLNHWFYVLSIGESGTNDTHFVYNVEGIGIDKASKIIFRTEANYLTANSQYQDARNYSIQAAIDLYGESSKEALQTENAWNAVGVYHKLVTPTALSATALNASSIKLSWKDNSKDEKGFKIERGTVSSNGFTEIATVNANLTTYTDKNLATNEIYFYRVKAYNDKGISDYSNVANASLGNVTNVLIMKDTLIKTCDVLLLDPGAIGDYPNDKNIITTFTPSIAGNKVALTFSEFDLEPYYDFIFVNDGADINAPLLGSFTGNEIPPRLVATNAEGKLTLQFISGKDKGFPGFKAKVTCLNPNTPPDAPNDLFASAFLTKVNLNWKDKSFNEKGFIIERSTNATSGFSKIAQTAANVIAYADIKTSARTIYYYRIKAFTDQFNSPYSNVDSAKTGEKPIIMKNNLKVKTCSAVFLDPGGFDNIADNAQAITTIQPATSGKRIEVSFSELNLNYGSDVLMVYDGPDVNSPVLFDGSLNSWTDTLAATNSSGVLTFKLTAGTANYPGWVANVRCINFPPKAPSELKAILNSSNYIALNWKDNSGDEDAFIIYKSYYTNQSYWEIARVPGNTKQYVDENYYSEGVKLYYKIVATNKAGGKSAPSNEATFIAPVVMSTTWFYNCDYPLLDPGATANYSDNANIKMILYPNIYRTKLSLSFKSFDTEKDHDFLSIYDGEDASAPLVGKFSGNTLPPQIKSTNSQGALTLVFTSDAAKNKPGWEVLVSCAVSSTKPSEETSALRTRQGDNSELTTQIMVFPNPASSSFKIQLPPNTKWESIDAVDLNGVKKTLLKGTLSGELDIDATQMKKGLNMIWLRSKAAVVTRKIIIE